MHVLLVLCCAFDLAVTHPHCAHGECVSSLCHGVSSASMSGKSDSPERGKLEEECISSAGISNHVHVSVTHSLFTSANAILERRPSLLTPPGVKSEKQLVKGEDLKLECIPEGM